MRGVSVETDLEIPDGYAPDTVSGFEQLIGPLYSRTPGTGEPTWGFRVEAAHVNGRQTCHGGMLTAFADLAWGKPLRTYGYDAGWATVRLTTDFLAPAPIDSWVEAVSQVIGVDGDLFIVAGHLWTSDVTLMTGSALYKGYRKRS